MENTTEVLKKGTLVKLNGLPCELLADCEVLLARRQNKEGDADNDIASPVSGVTQASRFR